MAKPSQDSHENSSPNVFDYTDYRAFLTDTLATMKSSQGRVSYRYLARICGFSSSGHLKMVMDGERNLTSATVHDVASAFKLSGKRKSYFEALVLFNQAKNESERVASLERLTSLKPVAEKLTRLERDCYEYFTRPHYVAIRELAWLPDFENDPAWIAAKLAPDITAGQAREALEVLIRLKLLKRGKSGKLVPHSATISTPDEVSSLDAYRYHDQMISYSRAALYKVGEDERDFSGLTVPVKKSLIPEIKKRIAEFRESLVGLVNAKGGPFEAVYQVNVQCFPLTKK